MRGQGASSRLLRALRHTVVLGLLALTGCGGGNGSAVGIPGGGAKLDPALLTPGCYDVRPAQVLSLAAPVADYTWNDPSVLKVGGVYWMYASATDFFVFPVRIYRLVSTDGVAWTLNPATPVLSEGPGGTWDEGGVETPAVVRFGGQYHLFYTGYSVQDDVTTYRVGHATSSDGVTWSKVAGNPVVAPSGVANDFHQFLVGEPGPVVVGDTLHLYFTAVGYNVGLGAPLQVVGVTTSSDGVDWSAPASTLESDQAQYPRSILPDGGWHGYSTPNAMVLGGQVHLFYDVAYDPPGDGDGDGNVDDWLQVRLHHARSPNGLTGWVQDAAPFMARGDLPWTAREVRAPHALLDGTKLRLYFAGDSVDFAVPPATWDFGIGLATCDLAAS